jgi:hypothetical protein
MAKFAVLFGVLLIAVGCIGYFEPSIFGKGVPQASPTGLIPAWFGAALALCGLVSLMKPSLNKHLMHFAAMVGLFGAAGGFMPLVRGNFDFTLASNVAGMLMTGLSIAFVVLCVRSFIQARQARTASQSPKT